PCIAASPSVVPAPLAQEPEVPCSPAFADRQPHSPQQPIRENSEPAAQVRQPVVSTTEVTEQARKAPRALAAKPEFQVTMRLRVRPGRPFAREQQAPLLWESAEPRQGLQLD